MRVTELNLGLFWWNWAVWNREDAESGRVKNLIRWWPDPLVGARTYEEFGWIGLARHSWLLFSISRSLLGMTGRTVRGQSWMYVQVAIRWHLSVLHQPP